MMADGQSQKSHARVAFALVCGLAVCCAVMYVTADGAESILITDIQKELRVESVDVKKVDTIITDDTPDGRVKLIDYFKKVEKQIASEVASRKEDIASIRTQMEKNREYNAKARDAMRKDLLLRMAANAKQAKSDLDKQMAATAKNFADQANVENERNKETIERSLKTREIMSKNKAEHAHDLKAAVLNQQKALAALDAATSAKIHKANEDIAAAAALIKSNAIKARNDLDKSIDNFNSKMFNMHKEAEDGRSKLAAEAATMDKKVRAEVTLKMKEATSWAAKEFQDVRSKMAEDRKHADEALAAETTRFSAALASQAALQDDRFAKTVADISAAREEANKLIESMSQGFKMSILQLTSTVTENVGKLNKDVNALQGVITSDRLEQAKVNAHVNAEIQNMIDIGLKREETLAKQDAALRGVMEANKEQNQQKLDSMAKEFYLQLTKIREQMKKDREFQSKQLAEKTTALFDTLKQNQEQQAKINEALTQATHQARLDAADNLRSAKEHFAARVSALTSTVAENDQKANKKILALTGVVAENAAKDAHGRQLLKMQAEANKKELQGAINDAIAKGEKRAQAVEDMAKTMNKKTQDALNSRISTEISTLRKSIHSDIEGLTLQTKESRAQMKKEILISLRESQSLLKQQLGEVISYSNKRFQELESTPAATSPAGKAAQQKSIDAEKKKATDAIVFAVAAQAKGLLALKAETELEIKKGNTNIAAYGELLVKHAKDVTDTMKNNVKTLKTKLQEAKFGVQKGAQNAKVAGHVKAIDEITAALEQAEVVNTKKFGDVYVKLGADRVSADQALAAAVGGLNDALAKHAALADARFHDTVKDLAKAQKDAWEEVKDARKNFAMSFALAKSELKASEYRVQETIENVADVIIDEKIMQARVNEIVGNEIKRVFQFANEDRSSDKRARGKIGELMNKNKAVAQNEVRDLAKTLEEDVQKTRHQMAAYRLVAAQELTDATKKLYLKLNQNQQEEIAAQAKLAETAQTAKVSTATALKNAEASFETQFSILVNTEASNHPKYLAALEHVTGVAHNWKVASAKDKELLSKQGKILSNDLNKAIVRAITLGEAQAQKTLEHADTSLDAVQRALTQQIAEQVEATADTAFASVTGQRAKIAQNYLSVKGYAKSAKDAIEAIVQQGGMSQGALSSIGDFLYAVSLVADNHTPPAEGVSSGSGVLSAPFSGTTVKESTDVSKVNGLVNEYMQTLTQASMRWPYGIGKYLLYKLSHAMTATGLLQVGEKEGKEGQWVYVSAKAVGLSHKLDLFTDLGVRISHYQEALAKITADLPAVQIAGEAAAVVVPAPQWQGD